MRFECFNLWGWRILGSGINGDAEFTFSIIGGMGIWHFFAQMTREKKNTSVICIVCIFNF